MTQRNQDKEEKYKATVLTKRLTNEPPLDQEEEQAIFLDDCFGEGVVIEFHLDKATNQMKKDEGRAPKDRNAQMKAKALKIKKAEYKEHVMQVL